MKVAFTGTLQGMTKHQQEELFLRLAMNPGAQFHHGGAPGADRQAHYIARELEFEDIHVWLPARKTWTDEVHTAVHHTRLPPLQRNHLIIGHADLVIAAPAQHSEIRRSGTWATVRYARKANLQVVVLAPWPTNEGNAA